MNMKYVINDAEAEIIKGIFNSVLEHKKIVEIADELNSKGIPYKDGKKFDTKNIARILRNEKYIGIARFNEMVFDNVVPPIIDEAVFNEVRKELEKHKHKNKASKVNYNFLLSDKMVCGLCGKNIHGHSGTTKTKKMYHYYKCKGAITHTCELKHIKKEYIEDFVVKQALEYVLSPDVIAPAASRMSDYFNSISNDNTEIKSLETVLKEINKKLDNSLKAIQEGVYTKSIGKVISDLESDKDKVENDILKLKSKTRKELDFEKCYQFLLSLAYLDIEKESNKEMIINKLVKK